MLCSVQRFQVTQSYQPVPLSLSNVNCHAIAYSWKKYGGDHQCQLLCDSYFEVRCSCDGKCRRGFDLLIEVLTGMRGQLLMG